MKKILLLSIFILSFGMIACDSDSVDEIAKALDGPSREDVNPEYVGLNASVTDTRFGSKAAQFEDIRENLGIKHIRVAFEWTNDIQETRDSEMNMSVYDDIASNFPEDAEVIIVLKGLPTWMEHSGTWKDGNPRTHFVDNWVQTVATRYSNNQQIVGYQIWDDPNETTNKENVWLGVRYNPDAYLEMLARAYSVIKDRSPNKFVINGSTTSINQRYPDTLDYNKALYDGGIEYFVDKFAISYFGKQYENVVLPDGIRDFLKKLTKPILVTSSGTKGLDQQLAYVEQTWPYLRDKIPAIERFYYYQYAEDNLNDETYGLRNTHGVSDFYRYLVSKKIEEDNK